MKNSIFIVFLGIAIILTTSSCKKGDIGPQGPIGLQGIPGKDGNANVHSYQYSATSSNWGLFAPNYFVDLDSPFITQDILDNGAILVYMGNGSGAWLSLPFTTWHNGFGHLTNQVIALGAIRIWVSDSNLNQVANPNNQTFKVVTIAGSAKNALLKNIDLNNYQEVAKHLNITN